MDKNDFFKNKDNIIAIIGIIFFVLLAIFARFTTSSNDNTEDNKNGNQETIEKDNQNNDEDSEEEIGEETISYNFTYTIDNNNQISIVEGKFYNNKQKFSIIENGIKQEYAKLEDNYLKLENGTYEILKGDINDYFKYLDLEDIIEFTEYSIYEEDDDTKIYEIDVPELIDKYNLELEYNGFDEFKSDSITIEERKGIIKEIILDYSNYFSYITNSKYSFKVTMKFNDYGKVEDFEI